MVRICQFGLLLKPQETLQDDTTAGDQESGSKSSAGEEAESYYYKDILEDAFKQLRSVTLDLQSRLENLVAQ